MSLLLAQYSTNVTLSGEIIADQPTSRTATAGIRFNADGTMDSLINVTYSQIDAATDWIFPNEGASSDFDVRVTNVVWNSAATGFDTEAASEDTWIDLGSARTWSIQDTTSSAVGNKDVNFDIEIRDNAGTTVATGAYQLIAEYDTS